MKLMSYRSDGSTVHRIPESQRTSDLGDGGVRPRVNMFNTVVHTRKQLLLTLNFSLKYE